MNKVITILIVILALISAGLGYYSYTLNQQVISVTEQITSLRVEYNSQLRNLNEGIDAILPEINYLKEETGGILKSIVTLTNEIGGTQAGIDNVGEKIDDTALKVSVIEDEIGGAINDIAALENEIATATLELAQSAINANSVYEKVSQTSVRISDGENVVGSGFLFDNEAHIMTAHHVIDGLPEIYVVFPDGNTSRVTVTGKSPDSDVAVLSLQDGPDIEAAVMADSSELKIGEPVVAIGNPFGLSETLTVGVVSQINRTSEIEYDSQTRWINNLIQFDAAANFGNSGGLLANSRGEIVGMVIARIGPEEGDGIYWAVSSNKFKKVAASLIDKGYFDYPWLGILVSDITPNTAQSKALETVNGVLVQGIMLDSPAVTSEIKAGDVLVSVNGMAIRDVDRFTAYLGEFTIPGDLAVIELIRGTDNIEISLTVGKRPS